MPRDQKGRFAPTKPSLKTRAMLKLEQVRDAEATGKVVDVVTTAGKTTLDACGFAAYTLGRMFRPLTKSVRSGAKNLLDDYRKTYPKED